MNEIIGNKLKKILKREGINAKEFGKMIGKSEQRIYQYYNATKFDSDQIIEFSNIFKVPIAYWFDDEGYRLNQSVVGDGSAASIYGNATVGVIADKDKETRSHTDNFGENNVKCLIAKGICRFVPHSSAGGF
ncbi:helix-turn-helix domain-containing protein [Phocaeicola vulgatus]|uniref:helix-turn-helix transcriptional regulator n=1 Tax=Phocaeicola vulgatus TaxID=821 RepID=UPI0021661821|nr:helix-turn-helix transcriptional regulator [Phocaeicola vulgatus]MCS2903694.1 helix-turn-helix domain-containing protein [Phocaeicola vulgatus]